MIKEMIKNKDKRQEIFEKMDNFLKQRRFYPYKQQTKENSEI